MKVVLDTGILIASLITVETPPDQIYKAWKKKRFELFTSEWQLEEFRRVSRYPKLKNFINPVEAGQMVNGLRLNAHVYASLPTVDLCKAPDDNPILAIALECKADFLVTGDKRDLLSMQRVGATPIVTAAHFLESLERIYR
jgi:putative PIN family toxin of toxin-antitoxin system